jgi:hypothetical protein
MNKDEALDLALEFVEANHFGGQDAFELITAIKQAAAQPAPELKHVEFGMNGEKMMFKVGVQQFTLDYEPDTQDEFNFMRDMLIHAFSTFTPDVKTTPPAANRQWTGLTDEDKEFIELTGGKSDVMLAEMVDAKLKERNV